MSETLNESPTKKRKPAAKTSVAWKFFKWHNEENREVICELCHFKTFISQKSKSTSPMLSHVRKFHQEQLKYIQTLHKAKSDLKVETMKLSPASLFGNKFSKKSFHEKSKNATKMKAKEAKVIVVGSQYAAKMKARQAKVIVVGSQSILKNKSIINIPSKGIGSNSSKTLPLSNNSEHLPTKLNTPKLVADESVTLGNKYHKNIIRVHSTSKEAIGRRSDISSDENVFENYNSKHFLSNEANRRNLSEPEGYKLHHTNHPSMVLKALAEDEAFMDMTLTAEGRAIKAHKSVMSAMSPYFESVLKANPCQHPVIVMPRDISFQELQNIVTYIYKGELTIDSNEVKSLLKTADTLQIVGLSRADEADERGGAAPSPAQGCSRVGSTREQPLLPTVNAKKKRKREASTAKQEKPVTQDSTEKVNPMDFLNSEMIEVKQELVSDAETEEGKTLCLAPTELTPPPLETHSLDLLANVSSSKADEEKEEEDKTKRRRTISTSSSSCSLKINTSSSSKNTKEVPPAPPPSSSDLVHTSSSISEREDCLYDDVHNDSDHLQTGPFVCPYCFQSHRPKHSLQLHLSVKHPSKYSCICKCGRVFTRDVLLSNHEKMCSF